MKAKIQQQPFGTEQKLGAGTNEQVLPLHPANWSIPLHSLFEWCTPSMGIKAKKGLDRRWKKIQCMPQTSVAAVKIEQQKRLTEEG